MIGLLCVWKGCDWSALCLEVCDWSALCLEVYDWSALCLELYDCLGGISGDATSVVITGEPFIPVRGIQLEKRLQSSENRRINSLIPFLVFHFGPVLSRQQTECRQVI